MMKFDKKTVATAKGIPYSEKFSGRIGGNAPCIFDHEDFSECFTFYATLVHPSKKGFVVSIFLPRSYQELLDGYMYPSMAVKVIEHIECEESQSYKFVNTDLNKKSISNYEVVDEPIRSSALIKLGGTPDLVQDEDYYAEKLKEDGFEFLLQIDEDHYPNGLLSGSYPFSYGAFYVYCKWVEDSATQIIGGYWQHS